MSGFVASGVPCAKGAICYSLDEFSKGDGARQRISNLRNAIAALQPSYNGLAEAFDQHLLSLVINNAGQRAAIVDHLKRFWFDADSATPFFSEHPVPRIYGEGTLKTLDLSLAGKDGKAVPINSWWILDTGTFRILNLAEEQNGATVSENVTMLILTPRPMDHGQSSRVILGDVAEAFVTERIGHAITTQRVRDI
jgi:hypothetical protein